MTIAGLTYGQWWVTGPSMFVSSPYHGPSRHSLGTEVGLVNKAAEALAPWGHLYQEREPETKGYRPLPLS